MNVFHYNPQPLDTKDVKLPKELEKYDYHMAFNTIMLVNTFGQRIAKIIPLREFCATTRKNIMLKFMLISRISIYIAIVWTVIFMTATQGLSAQSLESGYTKEYNGQEEKSALSGVELNIVGSSSTVSDENGFFELRFPILKPGENVVCNEIYKEGYIIFNKDALAAWRISNNQQPFIIVLCKEKQFRELKKKYYNIFEKSYKKEYEAQKEKAIRESYNNDQLQHKLENIEREYKEKIGNINTYTEIFSRIDHNAMNEIEAEALRLLESGEIDAAIRKYEELSITQQSDEQIIKLSSGITIIKAGQELVNSAHHDLIALVEKLKTQLGLYEAGGSEYNVKKKTTTEQLVEVYRALNTAFDGAYNEELGKWLIQLSELEDRRDQYLQLVKEAATLPSSDGLYELGRIYEIQSFYNDSLLNEARMCYEKSATIVSSFNDTSIVAKAALRLQQLPVVSIRIDSSELFFRILDEEKRLMAICPKSSVSSCIATGIVDIPSTVRYHGETYKVTRIDERAFAFNKKNFKLTIPASLTFINYNAFLAANITEITFKGKYTIFYSYSKYDGNYICNIPANTIITSPTHAPFMYSMLRYRYLTLYEHMRKVEEPAYISLLEYLIQESKDLKDKSKYQIDLAKLYADTTSISYDSIKAKKILTQAEKDILAYPNKKERVSALTILVESFYGKKDYVLYDSVRAYSLAKQIIKYGKPYIGEGFLLLGNLLRQDGQYEKALECYDKSFGEGEVKAAENIAEMIAIGQGVDKDINIAHTIIDSLIKYNPDDVELYTMKGEFCLMQNDTLTAKQYCDSSLMKMHESDKEKYEEESYLYYICYPDSVEKTKLRKQKLQRLIDIAQAVSKIQYEELNKTPLKVEYEELLAISIIALQVLMKNKTEQQLEKYNDAYFATAIRWALRNELRIRQGRFFKLYIFDYLEIASESEYKGYDNSLFVRITIYQTILDIYKYHISHSELEISAELIRTAEYIYQAIDNIPEEMQLITKCVLIDKILVEDIAKNVNKSFDAVLAETQNALNLIMSQLNDSHL